MTLRTVSGKKNLDLGVSVGGPTVIYVLWRQLIEIRDGKST